MGRGFKILTCASWIAVSCIGLFYLIDYTFGRIGSDDFATRIEDYVVPLITLSLLLVGLLNARRQWRAPVRDVEMPPLHKSPPVAVSAAEPLREQDRQRLFAYLDTFQKIGLLLPGEVDREELASLGTYDEGHPFDLMNFIDLLAAHARSHGALANCAFQELQAEILEPDIRRMIEGAVRLSGRTDMVSGIGIEKATRSTGQDPRDGQDAEAYFTLGRTSVRIPLTMYRKSPPAGLIEGLAQALGHGDGRCFAQGFTDFTAMLLYQDPETLNQLQALSGDDGNWMERYRSGS